ncbi:MAG: chemotaxis protein CheX [Clostridia bacterium]|jgi:chemotaxis protein CheX|nr:chemotaxis protein CheX [Clostridia bacterium]MCI1999857.1 chemotaxis protein CheX [Clostridia bacterium]MCI2014227.1 chemotaxis protein CheX [Clostridia bacterium]
MSNDIFSPFLDATRSVFKLMFDISDVNELPIENFKFNDAVIICIGVTGDLEGNIVYKFPRNTSLTMVNIMSGMEIESVDDFVTSAISEIANIISGNVVTMFTEKNVKCDILPPVLGNTEDDKTYALTNDFCVSTSIGKVCIDIRLNQKNK